MNTLKLRFGSIVIISVSCLLVRWSALSASSSVFANASANSSFLIDSSGTMSSWGDNGSGQLGVGGYADQASPVMSPFPTGVTRWRSLATMYSFNSGNSTYAIGNDSQLYVAGFNGYSAPGALYFTRMVTPGGVGGCAAVTASSLGWLAISTNGQIFGNANGAVWWPPRPGATRWTQVAATSFSGSTNEQDLFALDDRGKLFGVYSGTAWFPSPWFVEIPIPAGAGAWTNIAAGGDFMLAQANDGNLYGWGHNNSGWLGLGFRFGYYTNAPQRIALPVGKTGWKAIAAGQWHTMATTTDGQLFTCGYNAYGQLGLGGSGTFQSSLTPVPNLTNVTAIAAGYWHCLAVADCQVLAWGGNSSGELGAGFMSPFYPLPVGTQFSYDICSTNPPTLPLVSINVADASASEVPRFPGTNTGRFEISRALATATSLEVKLSASGTASNGVDYVALPPSITIPAYSNSASLLVIPAGSTLAADPSTVTVRLLTDPAYQLGNSTNATVTLVQYEVLPPTPMPVFTLQLFVGTNLNGQVFVAQASTNLTDWSNLGTGTNVWGVVTVTETNRISFRQRFFRAFPLVFP